MLFFFPGKYRKFLFLSLLILTITLAICNLSIAQDKSNKDSPKKEAKTKQVDPGEIYLQIRNKQIDFPAKIFLNQYAELLLPQGLSFIPTENSEMLLNMMGNEGGRGLKGIVVHTNDFQMKWYIVIRDVQFGYVRDHDAEKIDSEKLINRIRSFSYSEATNYAIGQGIGKYEIENVDWIIPPKYDSQKNTLSWLLQTRIKGADNSDPYQIGINYKSNLLYRYGLIQLNFSSTFANVELGTHLIEQITSNISFNNNSQYQHFNPKKDKIAPVTVSQLITGKKPGSDLPDQNQQTNSIDNQNYYLMIWFYGFLVILVICFIGYEIITNKNLMPSQREKL